MAWTQPPGPREDMCLEGLMATDGSGNYVSDWLDSGGVLTVRLAARFLNVAGNSLHVDEAVYDGNGAGAGSTPRVVRSQSVTLTNSSFDAFATLDLTCRWFRVSASGDPSDYVALTVRKVG